MTTDELRLLNGLLDQLKQIRGIRKDAEAERLIRQAAEEQPDALYLLVQKTLLQDQALDAAKNRIHDLQRQLSETPPGSGGFLGQNPWSQPAPPARSQAAPASAWPAAGGAMAPPQQPGGMSSFLGSAAATAAGIAGGAFLFQGIESLMGHHNHGGFGNDVMDHTGYEPQQVENVTINEYYGDQAGRDSSGLSDVSDSFGQDDLDSYDDDVNSVDV